MTFRRLLSIRRAEAKVLPLVYDAKGLRSVSLMLPIVATRL